MARIKRVIKFIQFNKYHSHFAVELLLLLILTITVGGNLVLAANFERTTVSDQSLLFAFLKYQPELNQKLFDAYESVSLTLSGAHNMEKQVLAASTKKNDSQAADTTLLPTLGGQALMKPNPSASSPIPKKDVEIYEVRGGDTIARIAAAYGVDERTIMDENNVSANIRPGQSLVILPTTGVKHVVKDGETLDSISKKYGVDTETVLEYNEIEIEEHIFPGEEIIIPNGVKPAAPTRERQQYLASLKKEDYQKAAVPDSYQGTDKGFIWPMPAASRLSQKFWSRHRAIDVPCRDCQVNAVADGIVEISGWQTGYGYTILLNHGNGYQTRYGHASKLLVTAGETVAQGQAIMISGSTGRSTGPHLHFEIKKNGAYLDPMKNLSK